MPTDAWFEDQYWKAAEEDWPIPPSLMAKFGRAVYEAGVAAAETRIAELRGLLFDVYRHAGSDTDGARTADEFFGPITFPVPAESVALEAVKSLREEADDDSEITEAVAAERERCARIAETQPLFREGTVLTRPIDVAAAIRADDATHAVECCGACPPIVGGGIDCTCAGNPRCPGPRRPDDREEDR